LFSALSTLVENKNNNENDLCQYDFHQHGSFQQTLKIHYLMKYRFFSQATQKTANKIIKRAAGRSRKLKFSSGVLSMSWAGPGFDVG